TIAVLDEAAAGGRLADDLEAGAPELGGDRFDLRKARHPLLVLQRKSAGVVANDIALPAPAQALIVSGPNAGGKTVTITGVGLGVDRLAPTYRLRLGEVGASSAIEIARRVGLSEDVCARAREILGSGASVVSQAVERLEKERAETARLRGKLESAREDLARERAAVQRERERLRELEQETRTGARRELIDDLRRKREEVATLVAQLQAAPAMAQAVETQRSIESAVATEEREQAQ